MRTQKPTSDRETAPPRGAADDDADEQENPGDPGPPTPSPRIRPDNDPRRDPRLPGADDPPEPGV